MHLLGSRFWRDRCAGRRDFSPSRPLPLRRCTVKDIRLWAGPDATRVVFDLSGPRTLHALNTAESRSRRGDIASARFEKASLAMPSGQGFAKQLRAGSQGQDLRLVVDLTSPATPRTFMVGAAGSSRPSAGCGSCIPVRAASRRDRRSSRCDRTDVVKAAPASNGRDIIVAIDAGHGGNDPGAMGRTGAREKEVTLAIARRLKERIDANRGCAPS